MDNIETFKYKSMRPMGFFLAFVVASIVAVMSIVSIQRYPFDQYLPVLLFFIPLSISVLALSIFAYRDVVVSAQGIRRPYLNFKGRLVAWEEMTCLRCVGMAGDGKTATGYLIRTKLRLPSFGISLMSIIERPERLSEVLDAEFCRRKLPVVVWRSGEWVPLEYLPRLKGSRG